MFVVGFSCQSVRGSLLVEIVCGRLCGLDGDDLGLMFESLLQDLFDWRW